MYRGNDFKRIVGVNSRVVQGSDPNQLGTTNMHTRFDPNTQWDVAGWVRTIGVSAWGARSPVPHFDDCKPIDGANGKRFQVCGALLSAYEAGGGVARLGLPTQSAGLEDHEAYGLRWAQRFEYAVVREREDRTAFVDRFASRCDGKRVGGFYCGPAVSDINPKHLYQCTAGAVPVLTVCENGCRSMPSGVPDKCNDEAPPPRDLCANTSSTGVYCAHNFDPTNTKTLLRCESQRTASSVACARGCKAMPPGVPDVCNN